jgi:protein-S-isoprenylcysteine O-methyltransferase Ste14
MGLFSYESAQVTAVTICWIVFIVFWLVSAFNAKKYVHRGSWGMGIRILIAIAIVVLLQFPSTRDFLLQQQFTSAAVQWLGVVLCACGVAFAIWARVYLGRNWGMPMSLKQNAELVTTGPYAYVRHPIYTGMILAMLGTTLVIVWWIVALVCFFVYFIYAARTEEKIMTNEFPNQYPDYMKRSKMLIPFVF